MCDWCLCALHGGCVQLCTQGGMGCCLAFVSSPGPTFRAYKCVPGRQCYVITYTGRPPATHAWAMCDGVDTETLRTRAPRVWQCIVFAARNKGGSMPCSPRKRNAPESPRGALSPKRQSGLADLAGLERSASESEQASASGSRSLSPMSGAAAAQMPTAAGASASLCQCFIMRLFPCYEALNHACV